MKQSLRHRFEAVKAAVESKAPPANVTEFALYKALNNEKPVPREVERAYDIFNRPNKREVVESLLLIRATPLEI